MTFRLFDLDTFPIFLMVLLVSPRLSKRSFQAGPPEDPMLDDDELALESSSPEDEPSSLEPDLDEPEEELLVPEELDDPEGKEGEPPDALPEIPVAGLERTTRTRAGVGVITGAGALVTEGTTTGECGSAEDKAA